MERPETVNDLTARIERLERENRRFKAIALLSFVAVASLAVMAPSRGGQADKPVVDEIRAKKIVVVDTKGNVRATLDTKEMGWPYLSRASLTILSADNNRKAVLSSDNLLNQVSLENNQTGAGAKVARMQVGTEGVGLEMSEFFLPTSSYNLFGVHWASDKPGAPPALELTKSRPNASVRITPTDPPGITLTNAANQQRTYSLR
jgi:hypothetical protein